MEAPTPIPLETLLAHREWVQRVARALVRDESLAQDLEQDLWVRAIENPPVVRGSVRGWLAAKLRSTAIDRFRSESSRNRREQTVARPERQRSTEELVAQAEAHKRVVVAVMDLKEPYRSTILLRYFEAMEPREVALRQEVPVETVRTRLKRGLVLLRQRFRADSKDGGESWSVALLPLTGSGETMEVPRVSMPGPAPWAPAVLSMGGLLMAKKVSVALLGLVALFGVGGGAVLWWILGQGGPVSNTPSETPLRRAHAPTAEVATTATAEEGIKRVVAAPQTSRAEPDGPSTTPAPPAGLTGRVFDEARRPAAGARAELALNGEPAAKATVDSEGNLLLPPIMAPTSGRFFMNVVVRDAQGRIARSNTISGRAYGASVARGDQPLSNMLLGDLVLRPARGVNVRVLAGGRPVAGAFVHAESDRGPPAVITDEVIADDSGRARIEDLWDGTWVVYARSPSFGRGRATVAVDSDSAEPVEVSLTYRDVEVEVVHAGSGAPVEGAILQIHVSHDTPHWDGRWVEEFPPLESAPTDSVGRTRIRGLGHGEALRVHVLLPGMDMPMEGVPSTLVAGDQYEVRIEIPGQRRVTFPLARGGTYTPAEGSLIRVDGRDVQVEGGTIVVDGLPPTGPVDLVARAPDGALARLRAANGADQGEEAVFLPPRELNVMVRDEDGTPVTHSSVLVFDLDGKKSSRLDAPDAEGRTRIARLVAGKYVVVAGASWNFGGGEVARVDLTDGDHSIDVVLGREFTVVARISVAGVRRLPADLKCQAIYPHPWSGLEGRETLTGEEDPARGEVRYRVRALQPGAPVRLRFETPRYAPSHDVAPPTAGEEAIVDVELK